MTKIECPTKYLNEKPICNHKSRQTI